MEQNAAATDVCGPETHILYDTGNIFFCFVLTPVIDSLLFLPDLSLEFLMGRTLDNAMLNVGLKDVAKGG